MILAAPRYYGLGSLSIVDNLCNPDKQILRFWSDHALKLNNSMKFCLSSSTAHYTRLELHYIPNSRAVLNYTFGQIVTLTVAEVLHKPMLCDMPDYRCAKLALVHQSKSRRSFVMARLFHLEVETRSTCRSTEITADSWEPL
jgi:hypothetical protein